jgi:uncharacterized membrane protein YbhN (UPF0104 family)
VSAGETRSPGSGGAGEPVPADDAPARRPRWRTTLPVAAALILLALVIHVAGPDAVVRALRSARWQLVGLALLVVVGTTLLGAFNAWQLGGLHGRVPLPRFIAAFWSAWAVGLVLPGQVGDLVWLTALLRRFGIPVSQAAGRLGVDKLIALLVALGAVAALPWATSDARMLPLAAGAAVAIAALLGAVAAAPAVAGWIGARLDVQARWRRLLSDTLEEAGDVVRRTPGRAALDLLLSLGKFALTGVSYWLVFAALGEATLPLWPVAVIAASAGLVAYIPISFNGVGTVEFTGVLLFSTLGIPAPVVASAYLLLRAVNLAVAWIPVAVLLPVLARAQR